MKPPQRPRKRSYFESPERTNGKALSLLGAFVFLVLCSAVVGGSLFVLVHFIVKYW